MYEGLSEQWSVPLLPPPLLLLFLTCGGMSSYFFFRSAVGHLNYTAVCSTEVCSLVSLSVLQTHTCYIFETDGAVRKIHKLISSWPEGKQAGFICSVLRQTVPTWARLSHSRCVCLPPVCPLHPVTLLTSIHHFGNKPFEINGYKIFPLLFFLLHRDDSKGHLRIWL